MQLTNSTPSISIVICSRNPSEAASVKRNLLGTAKYPKSLEIIIIDNREKNEGLCAVYNKGVEKANGRVIVFMHEDAWMMENEWDVCVLKKFRELPNIQILGVAGSSILVDYPYALWAAAGIPYTFGKVVHLIEKNGEYFLSLFNNRDGDQEVVAVDGLWFAARKTLFDNCRFDEKTFTRFHFYDLDICMQALEFGKVYVTTDVRVLHKSGGEFKGEWKEWSKIFIEKWQNKLPAYTSNITDYVPPSSANGIVSSEGALLKPANIDLRGKVPVPKW